MLGDGTVLIAGGASSSGGSLAALDSAEIYDPGSESFTSVGTAMNSKRVGHTATPLSNGTVLLAGGFNGSATLAISGGSVSWSATSGTVLDNAEIYNPGSQSFACVGGASGGSCASSMTPAVFPTATALSNGAVLIAGGFGGKKWRPQKTAQLFTGGQFQNTGNMKTARALHAAAVVQ